MAQNCNTKLQKNTLLWLGFILIFEDCRCHPSLTPYKEHFVINPTPHTIANSLTYIIIESLINSHHQSIHMVACA